MAADIKRYKILCQKYVTCWMANLKRYKFKFLWKITDHKVSLLNLYLHLVELNLDLESNLNLVESNLRI